MNLRLTNWIVESLSSDKDIVGFIRESDYDFDVCTLSIPEIKDIGVLENLGEEIYYKNQKLFCMVLETISWRNNLLKFRIGSLDAQNSKMEIMVLEY